MNTLIIHPNDSTTLFLNRIYKDLENVDIITTTVSNNTISNAIRAHDKIYLLGHGTEYGLLSSNFDRFIINSKHVQFLRNKEVVGIWCNADVFAEKYNLHGLFSGMVISELDESIACGVISSEDEINTENSIFAENLRYCLDNYTLKDIPKKFPYLNKTNTELTNFNYNSLYYF